MNSAWCKLLAFGVASAFAMSACKVSTDDDIDFPEGGTSSGGATSGGKTTGGKTSGGTSTGGTSTGGTSTGGTSTGGTTTGGTSTGGTTTGGTTNTGGTEPFKCMADGDRIGTPAESCDFDTEGTTQAEQACMLCLQNNCCGAIKKCYATNPRNQCAGTDEKGSELACMQACLIEVAMAGVGYDEDDEATCASSCAKENGCSFIADATNDAFVCLEDNCVDECILDLAM